MDQTVTLIGTGRMGSALAAALFNKGFATTVWNRTAAKTAPLAQLGLRVAPSVLDAVVQAGVIVVNINDYHATQQLLSRAEIESALRGKTIVQLTTGTPDEAREMEAWARPLDIAYLDGAIMSNPIDIGKPTGTVVYSGSEELFRRVKPVLLAFGGNAMFAGKEIGHASALDMAVLAFATGAQFGFLQGYVVYEAENLPAEGYVPFIKSLMPVLEMMLTRLHGAIQSKDYDDTQASLDVWAPCPKELIKWCRKHGVDHSFVDPQLSLMEKAIQAGKGQADFAYLYEVLKGSN
jgi:3-hydroxyisobutyrate dehydrogenase-like beta-hydroxyacid dehydrogenase